MRRIAVAAARGVVAMSLEVIAKRMLLLPEGGTPMLNRVMRRQIRLLPNGAPA